MDLLDGIRHGFAPVAFRDEEEPSRSDFPMGSGRQTEHSHVDHFQSDMIAGGAVVLRPEYTVEYINALEGLIAYNPDVGQAADNIVSLGDTEFSIEFGGDVPDAEAGEMQEHLNSVMHSWYNNAEGIHSLIGDLFLQLASSGAVSGEYVPKEDLSGIKEVVKVDTKTIRFKWDREDERFRALQKVNRPIESSGPAGYIELNELTYRYIAHRRVTDAPYALPPFLSAVHSISTQTSMMKNLDFMMKQAGLVGFLNVKIDEPQRKTNETDDQYQKRAKKKLSRTWDQIKGGLETGVMISFKGKQDIEHNSITQGSQGMADVYNLADRNVITGLKQAPELMGRQSTASETFGRVVLAKFAEQLTSYQRTVAEFLKGAFALELWMAGFGWNKIKAVTFEEPMVGDRKRSHQTTKVLLSNLIAQYKQGVISQEQLAQELGYDEPDQEEPRETVSPDGGDEDEGDEGSSGNPSSDEDVSDGGETEENSISSLSKEERKRKINEKAAELGAEKTPFPYMNGHDH